MSKLANLKTHTTDKWILYCTNCIFYPPTLPLPLNLPITQNCLHFLNFKKHHLVCFFLKPFGLQGHRKCPHKPCLRCNNNVIIHICVLINHIYKNTRTHARTHTHTLLATLNYLRRCYFYNY